MSKKVALIAGSFISGISSIELLKAIQGKIDADVDIYALPDGYGNIYEATEDLKSFKVEELTVMNEAGEEKLLKYLRHDDRVIVSFSSVVNYKMKGELTSTSYLAGALVKKLIESGEKKITISVGGSGVNDAAVGFLRAMGVKFYNVLDEEVKETRDIYKIKRFDTTELDNLIKGVDFIVFKYSKTRFIGYRGTTYQNRLIKDNLILEIFERNMENFQYLLQNHFDFKVKSVEAAGAGGGSMLSLIKFLNAKVVDLGEFLEKYFNFDNITQKSDIIILVDDYLSLKLRKESFRALVLNKAKQYDKEIIGLALDAEEEKASFIEQGFTRMIDLTYDSESLDRAAKIINNYLKGEDDMAYKEEALKFHEEKRGKLEVVPKVEVNNAHDLALAYTPGVAEPCKLIHEDPELQYKYTAKGNLIAVVTDGSAVLGLGNIGSKAGMPVMEGKSILFKKFGNVDAFPIMLDTQDVDEIVNTVKNIAPGFGGINLEDISAPRCFEIERKLDEMLDIPVFHDDQYGTAIVVTAALINACKLIKKEYADLKVVINGSGAAGIAIAYMMLNLGVKNILICDSKGIIYRGNEKNNWIKAEIAEKTNPNNEQGTLKDAMVGADVFIGVSAPGVLTKDMVKTMNKDAVVFAMANPVPEIYPDEAKEAGAKVVGTGRSDFPNQINNSLAFPGIFRGALDRRAKTITFDMKVAAAHAIAGLVSDEDLTASHIMPDMFDERVPKVVAKAVYDAYRE